MTQAFVAVAVAVVATAASIAPSAICLLYY
jgi:hypothetical protein